ncbi:MAG TPA: hypothetical protein VFS20_12845 [Longimicrobium sp.]|nr:hypothetical protein [Longimicrobium sp.]
MMHAEAETSGRSVLRREGSAFSRVAGWLISLIGRHAAGLEAFADRLEAFFQPALVVTHPLAGTWFATLDAVLPEDRQVAALIRLSRHAPLQPRKALRGIIENEERERTLFAQPLPSAISQDQDLLLEYSFPQLFSPARNIQLFREFAENELGRLRATDLSTPCRKHPRACKAGEEVG